jgi:hypothetical protein
MTKTVNNCLPIKKERRMNSMRGDYEEPRGVMVNRNDWVGLLGRFDVLAGEINRALGRATLIEEPRSGIRISRIA